MRKKLPQYLVFSAVAKIMDLLLRPYALIVYNLTSVPYFVFPSTFAQLLTFLSPGFLAWFPELCCMTSGNH